MDKQERNRLEQKYKDSVYEQYYLKSKLISARIINTKELGAKYFKMPDETIPNVAILVNNKLVEFSNLFKKAGISMFSATENADSEGELYYRRSFVGDAIMMDLEDSLSQAIKEIMDYCDIISNAFLKILISSVKTVSIIRKIEPVGKILNIKDKVNELFKDKKFFLTEEEEEMLDIKLANYRENYDKIINYELKDNIVYDIMIKIEEYGYGSEDIDILLENDIIPDLEKIGLSECIPELKIEIEEYKKDLQNKKEKDFSDDAR